MKDCRHVQRVISADRSFCAACGVLLSMTDPVVSAIVDSAPDSFATQLWLAYPIGRANSMNSEAR